MQNNVEVVTRLVRVGYDNTLGYLKNGLESWLAEGKEIDTVNSISSGEVASQLTKDTILIDYESAMSFRLSM